MQPGPKLEQRLQPTQSQAFAPVLQQSFPLLSSFTDEPYRMRQPLGIASKPVEKVPSRKNWPAAHRWTSSGVDSP